MSITNLHFNQTNVVAGGYSQIGTDRAMSNLMEIVFDEHPNFRTGELSQCINVARTRYGVTLCAPARKPLNCPYELWGVLHDLAEEMPRC